MKKKDPILLLTTLYSCNEENSNLPDGLFAKIATSKGDYCCFRLQKSTNNGRQLCYFGRR
jgi:hypothetical protein